MIRRAGCMSKLGPVLWYTGGSGLWVKVWGHCVLRIRWRRWLAQLRGDEEVWYGWGR